MDEQEKKKRKEKAYQDYVKTKTPVHNVYLNMAKAFVTGRNHLCDRAVFYEFL